MADDLTFIDNFGDASPFDYHGLFLFKRDDGDYFAIVSQNIHDHVGEREGDSMAGELTTEESVWLQDFWIDTYDLLEAKEELLKESGIDWNRLPNENPDALPREELEVLLATLAVQSRHPSSGYDGHNETYHSYVEAAKKVLEAAPHDEHLKRMLADELEGEVEESFLVRMSLEKEWVMRARSERHLRKRLGEMSHKELLEMFSTGFDDFHIEDIQ